MPRKDARLASRLGGRRGSPKRRTWISALVLVAMYAAGFAALSSLTRHFRAPPRDPPARDQAAVRLGMDSSDAKQSPPPREGPFHQHVKRLIASHESSIVFSRHSLKRAQEDSARTPFSCGSSHVVKLRSYRDVAAHAAALDRLLPSEDPLRPQGIPTCAIVGNAGTLLEHQFGPEIDAHDAVIRFNAGVTEGYEQFVGSKTTLR